MKSTTRLAHLALLLLAALPAAAISETHAVVLLYHHVDDDTPASTSVSPAEFTRHMDYLWDNNYFVLPLEEILDAVAKGESLPDKTVAITFDDAYASVHRTAWPLLRQRRWPFTVFVSTDYIDNEFDNYMTWPQLRELAAGGGRIGNHSLAHNHPLERQDGESRSAWLARFRADALQAALRIKSQTGTETRVYAWPYGEYNRDLEEIISELGWYGVGQQSGAIGKTAPLTSAPRFPISSAYADDKDFILRVRARPLPLTVLAPADRLLQRGSAAPRLELELDGSRYAPGTINCFMSDGTPVDVDRRGGRRLRIASDKPLPAGRSKYTCTAPHPTEQGVFAWYSHLWITR